MDIAAETITLLEAALEGNPTLASLAVVGTTPDTLKVQIAPGLPAQSIGGIAYDPVPPFRREILGELIVRMQRLSRADSWPEAVTWMRLW